MEEKGRREKERGGRKTRGGKKEVCVYLKTSIGASIVASMSEMP